MHEAQDLGLPVLARLLSRDAIGSEESPFGGVEELLQASIQLLGADMGNVQLYDSQRRSLKIVAQRGFETDFLEHFAEVTSDSSTACGLALVTGKRAVLENALEAAKEEDLDVIRRAGYVAVQSTPLMSRDNRLLGVVSTHYRRSRLPGFNQLRIFDQYLNQVYGATQPPTA